MTETQITKLEEAGEANSRMHLCAPISGTVIEKFALEGEYVKEGQAIYRLADLSTVWLMLELFPEDAAARIADCDDSIRTRRTGGALYGRTSRGPTD